jgi:hypothetical protein
MSDPKEFLARWSRRKLTPPEEKASPPAAGKDAAAAVPSDPEFDITKLPSLESIGPNSDVSAFLQRGVPASFTHAALRRAWSADPAIRDFVGLSENSWDFNAPNSLPGFGPLNTEEVRQAAARFFGELTDETTAQAPADLGDSTLNSAEIEQKASEESESGPSSAPVVQDPVNIAAQHDEEAAEQHRDDAESGDSPAAGKRHGGALPT